MFNEYRKFKIGEHVLHSDKHRKRKHAYVVKKIEELSDGGMVILTLSDGDEEIIAGAVEVYRLAGKKCPNCSDELYDEHLVRQYQFYCDFCDENFYGFEID